MFIKIRTLIVHGENDKKFQSAIETLKEIPSSEVLTIKNASHACYVDQPIEFHNGLRQFLYSVYRPIYIQQYKERSSSLLTSTSSSLLSSSLIVNKTKMIEKERKNITTNLTLNQEHKHLH